MKLVLNRRRSDEVAILACRGQLVCGAETSALREAAGALLHGAEKLVIDLRGIEKIDCAGLGALAGAAKIARCLGKSLELCSVPPRVRRLLAITRLDSVLKFHADEEGAYPCAVYAA